MPAHRLISGHHHPVLRVSGHPAPCFLAGPGRIILPAFSDNVAGLDVATARLPQAWRRLSLNCFASAGSDIFDFGPLETLSARLESAPRARPESPREALFLDESSLDRPLKGA